MIRQLTYDQLSLTRDLAVSFFIESRLPGTFNWNHFLNTWKTLVNSGMGAMFVHQNQNLQFDAVIGGLTYLCPLTGDKETTETFWYVMPEARNGTKAIRLFERLEQWAVEQGSARIKMAYLEDLSPEIVRDMYERRGYVKQETTYRKEL